MQFPCATAQSTAPRVVVHIDRWQMRPEAAIGRAGLSLHAVRLRGELLSVADYDLVLWRPHAVDTVVLAER
eukprot:m.123523 g.123523  ORF g.123523 m.123523 type:complete len:71 (-) comp22019_c0_seq1:1227-1439(-)